MDLHQFDAIWPTEPGIYPSQLVCLTISYEDRTGKHQEDICSQFPEIVVGRHLPLPEIIDASVQDGDEEIDSVSLNNEGTTFRFNNQVIGFIDIKLEGEKELLGWTVEWSVDRKSVTLTAPKEKELSRGKVYIIIIAVHDAAGNVLSTTITFATKA